MSPTVIKYIISRKVFVLGRKLYVRKICEICTTALGERRRLRRLHTGWDASWARSPCIFVVCSSILPPPPFRGGFCGAQYAVRLQQRDWILEIGLGEEEWTATVGEGGGAFGREASFVGGGIVVVEGCVDRMPPLPTGSPPLSIFLPCLDALCVYAEITRYDPQLPCPICRRRPEY